MHELFEHTADLGLRAAAPDLDTLFAEMAAALLSALVEHPDAVRPEAEHTITVGGTDREYLLFDWLNALLHRFDGDGQVFSMYAVAVRDDGLTAIVRGESFDPDRHGRTHEVKAITLHGLAVERNADGWSAEVIVDI